MCIVHQQRSIWWGVHSCSNRGKIKMFPENYWSSLKNLLWTMFREPCIDLLLLMHLSHKSIFGRLVFHFRLCDWLASHTKGEKEEKKIVVGRFKWICLFCFSIVVRCLRQHQFHSSIAIIMHCYNPPKTQTLCDTQNSIFHSKIWPDK